MKVSTHFQTEIQSYLEQRAEYDELFARSYRNPLKNIEDCITYILNEVQKSGCNGFADDEIFGMAVHGKSSVSCPLKPSDSAPLKHSTMPP